MKYFHGTTEFETDGPSAVTLGKFDGVHLGHQKLLRCISEQKKNGLDSVVFVLNSHSQSVIFTEEEQKSIAEQMGISCLISCPFVSEISGMQPEEFAEEILVKRLEAKYVAVGTDFRFGYRREGDAARLRQYGEALGFRTEIIEKKRFHDREISSTYVREALDAGDMETVTALLGRPFFVSGTVLHGRRIGRTLGMPTVNLIPPPEKILPPNGVYASITKIDDRICPGITNIGYKPTVGEHFRGVETYLFDVDMDLYGKNITTELYCFERPEQKFDSMEALKDQMHRDISFGKEYFRG